MIIKLFWLISLASYLTPWSGKEIEVSPTNASNLNRSYEDDKIQFAFPAHWSSKPVYRAISGSLTSQHRIGVVLSDGPFDLYLLTQYGHASGVMGGRFSEVAQYVVPWLKDDSPGSCFDIFKLNLNGKSNELVRADLILDPPKDPLEVRSSDPLCALIQRKVSHRVWAGAYFGYLKVDRTGPGFFINTPLGTDADTGGNQLVFAASIRATNADALPAATDPHLRLFLAEIDKVVAGIKYKNQLDKAL